MIDRPPEYGITCHCGMRITGTNEKGLVSLMKKHFETGEYHISYLIMKDMKWGQVEVEDVIYRAMRQREKKMPVPEGDLTTSEIWSDPNAVKDQTVEETQAVEVQEEVNATEPAVVEGGSETEG
jgi:hypothetical protein